jgi:outer membrane lipopolysaccharide assembly protein LptE/RlpB
MIRLAPFALLAALTGACGYHVSGRGDLMPKTVKTIAVMPFGNLTVRYKLARLLPTDIGREFISRTRYKVVADPNQADAVLTGTVINFGAYPVISDPNSGRATTIQVIVTVQVTLTNRATGAVIFTRSGFELRERYEVSLDPTTYFDESGTAMDRLSRDASRSIVSAILEAF